MKKQRIDFMTLLMVTLVAVLIWYWATGETRESRELSLDVIFQVAEPDLWSVKQPDGKVAVTATGSQKALGRAEALGPVVLDIDTEGGSRTIDLRAPLQDHPTVEATGVTIAEAPSLMVELDKLERSVAVVRPVLPGVRTLEDIEVDPPQVEVAIPERIRRRFPDALVVEAGVDRQQIEQLQRDVRHVKQVKLHLPDASPDEGVRIEPGTATVSFTIGLQERVVRLEAVRVQVLSAPEEYRITLDPVQLRDVEVTAPTELADAIENDKAVVVAVLQLKSSDFFGTIPSKPITTFMAIMKADGRGVPVDATVGGSSDRPMINLTIEQIAPPQ